MVPVLAFRDSPTGVDPVVMDQTYGEVPLEAARVTLVYTTPTVPLGSVGAVVMVGPAMIVMDMARVAVPPALSVTCTVKLEVPNAADVGVPLIPPPAVRGEKPAGNEDPATSDHV